MTKRNYTFYFLAVIAAAVVLNGIFTTVLLNSGDFVTVDKTVMSRALYSEAERILSGCAGSEYGETIASLEETIADLRECRRLYEETDGGKYTTTYVRNKYTEEELKEFLDRYPYTDSEATARVGMLEYCVKRLRNAQEYPDYVRKVIDEAETLAGMTIYDDAAKRRILRTANRFHGFEKIRVSAEPELGVNLLFENTPGNWVAVFMAVICAFLYYLRAHAGVSDTGVVRNRTGAYALLFFVGCLLLYVTGAFAVNGVFGLGDLRRSVQSLTDFYSSPYMISVGMLVGLGIGARAAACTALYLFVTGLLFCRKKQFAVLLLGTAVLTEFLLYYLGSAIRFLAAFRPERLADGYGSATLFGEAVDAGWALTIYLAVLLAAAFAFAGRQVSAALLREKERQEHLYFEEINNKYTEARYIRHDINNHLTVLALLMDEGRMEDARKYLDKISEQLDEVKPPVKTGSTVLDAVLFGKVKAAQEKDIEIKLDFAADFAESGISDYDLCSVFSNLLDNAIEACEKLSGERRVSLSVKRQEKMICVFCENRYAELTREGGGFASSKSDGAAHGLGLKRIRGIAEKYHGSVDINTETGLFSIAVLFMTD